MQVYFGRLSRVWDSCASVDGPSTAVETGTLSWSFVTPGWMICIFGCGSGENKAFLGGQKQGFMQVIGKKAGHVLLSAVSADTYS